MFMLSIFHLSCLLEDPNYLALVIFLQNIIKTAYTSVLVNIFGIRLPQHDFLKCFREQILLSINPTYFYTKLLVSILLVYW